jgi:hypothetical protein
MLGWAEARALRPARRRAVTRILVDVENTKLIGVSLNWSAMKA